MADQEAALSGEVAGLVSTAVRCGIIGAASGLGEASAPGIVVGKAGCIGHRRRRTGHVLAWIAGSLSLPQAVIGPSAASCSAVAAASQHRLLDLGCEVLVGAARRSARARSGSPAFSQISSKVPCRARGLGAWRARLTSSSSERSSRNHTPACTVPAGQGDPAGGQCGVGVAVQGGQRLGRPAPVRGRSPISRLAQLWRRSPRRQPCSPQLDISGSRHISGVPWSGSVTQTGQARRAVRGTTAATARASVRVASARVMPASPGARSTELART